MGKEGRKKKGEGEERVQKRVPDGTKRVPEGERGFQPSRGQKRKQGEMGKRVEEVFEGPKSFSIAEEELVEGEKRDGLAYLGHD